MRIQAVSGYRPILEIPARDEAHKTVIPEVKGAIPETFYVDTMDESSPLQDAKRIVSSASQQVGWSSSDTLSSYQSTAVEGVGATEQTDGWLNTLAAKAWRGMDTLKSWIGMATDKVTETAQHVSQNLQAQLNSFLHHFHPEDMLTGVKEMSKSLWNTLTFAEEAFSNPKTRSVQLPEHNSDGTPNLFGARRITRVDYRELVRFRDDITQLIDLLTELNGDGNCEALVVALMRALAKDKKEALELLRQKVQYQQKERSIDSDLRLKASEELIKRIQANRWYDWFFETTQLSTLAFSSLALAGVSSSWGWPIVMMVVAGTGIVNKWNDHAIEKTLGSATAKWIDNDTDVARERWTQRWKTAYQTGMTAMGLMVGMWNSAHAGHLVSKIITGLGSITTLLSSLRQTQLKKLGDHEQGEIEYYSDRLIESEKSVTSSTRDLATAYSAYSKLWKEAHSLLQSAAQTTQSLFRNPS